jgi:hypothetical protein
MLRVPSGPQDTAARRVYIHCSAGLIHSPPINVESGWYQDVDFRTPTELDWASYIHAFRFKMKDPSNFTLPQTAGQLGGKYNFYTFSLLASIPQGG